MRYNNKQLDLLCVHGVGFFIECVTYGTNEMSEHKLEPEFIPSASLFPTVNEGSPLKGYI